MLELIEWKSSRLSRTENFPTTNFQLVKFIWQTPINIRVNFFIKT